jgi:hypothetical protein
MLSYKGKGVVLPNPVPHVMKTPSIHCKNVGGATSSPACPSESGLCGMCSVLESPVFSSWICRRPVRADWKSVRGASKRHPGPCQPLRTAYESSGDMVLETGCDVSLFPCVNRTLHGSSCIHRRPKG